MTCKWITLAESYEKPSPPPQKKGKLCHQLRKLADVWSEGWTETALLRRRRGAPPGLRGHWSLRAQSPNNKSSSSSDYQLFVRSSSFSTRNNSYFHLHDCINYSITHVSRLQRCFPHRKTARQAFNKGRQQYIYSLDTSLINIRNHPGLTLI